MPCSCLNQYEHVGINRDMHCMLARFRRVESPIYSRSPELYPIVSFADFRRRSRRFFVTCTEIRNSFDLRITRLIRRTQHGITRASKLSEEARAKLQPQRAR